MNDRQSILLVDNDREYGRAMKKMLDKSGYDVTIAQDGKEALGVLSKNVFDLIISALRMPNVDGIEMMEEIRRNRITAPVIFITAYGEVESYIDVMNMGAFDYLNKPVKKQEILNVIKGALEEYGKCSVLS